MNPKIRTCTNEDIGLLVGMIRKSFRDVAERFSLTPETVPSHPSNYTADRLQKDLARGVVYFLIEKDGTAVGCVARELANPEVCYVERLAVLPDQRCQGLGKALVDHVLADARRSGAHSVSIGIIAEQTELKNWYRKIGFIENETKEFTHLPFRVAFLSYDIHEGPV
ncbi:MAG: GNAT family N-acetyltransferase [Deltaproteobacteria bacterium]|nr:GNAT family N-acetyltransferase [Deltaproteobacteria bacterium]